ncbi:MAG: hypothetical protein ACRBFS_00365 [Aureispira sp.]
MPNNLLDDFSALDGHQDDTAFEALKEYSNNGQSLIWTGRPIRGFRLRKADWALIPFSLVWGGISFGWETVAVATDAALLFQLAGIPFVIIGLYMIFGRFFHDKWYRSRTFYGLTKDALIIKRPKIAETIPFTDLNNLEVQEGKNGRGSLSFQLNYNTKKKQFPMVPAMGNTIDAIENVGAAYRIIRNYKKAVRNKSIDLSRP